MNRIYLIYLINRAERMERSDIAFRRKPAGQRRRALATRRPGRCRVARRVGTAVPINLIYLIYLIYRTERDGWSGPCRTIRRAGVATPVNCRSEYQLVLPLRGKQNGAASEEVAPFCELDRQD
jgi:hypothetical protein